MNKRDKKIWDERARTARGFAGSSSVNKRMGIEIPAKIVVAIDDQLNGPNIEKQQLEDAHHQLDILSIPREMAGKLTVAGRLGLLYRIINERRDDLKRLYGDEANMFMEELNESKRT